MAIIYRHGYPALHAVAAWFLSAGISMKEVTDKLLADGVKLFSDAFKTLLDAVGKTAGARA